MTDTADYRSHNNQGQACDVDDLTLVECRQRLCEAMDVILEFQAASTKMERLLRDWMSFRDVDGCPLWSKKNK